LPPINIQERISSFFSLVSSQIVKTDQIIQKTEVLKQGMMQELLTKGIGHRKFKKTKIGEIPEEWKILQMRDICSVRQGLQISIKQRKTEPGDNRYLYLTNQYLKTLDKAEYVENPPKSVICNEDDVLMTRTGNTGIVVTDVNGVFHNNFFLIDYSRVLINKRYFVYFLQSDMIQKMILDRAGSTTIPDLNHGDFYSIPFFCPPMEEQIKIAGLIQMVDKKISVENRQLNQLLNLKKGLMQDIFSQKVQIN
jgi:type I restriction enzyme S subunit